MWYSDSLLGGLVAQIHQDAEDEGLFAERQAISFEEMSPALLYDIQLGIANLIVNAQLPDDPALLQHQLINLQFSVVSPWAPVFAPPPGPGTYLLAHAYALAWPVAALWRPKRGVPWGRWYPPSGKHIALPILPGDRWRTIL